MWGAGVGGAAAFSQAVLGPCARVAGPIAAYAAQGPPCISAPKARAPTRGAWGLEAPPRVPVGRSRFLHPYFQGVFSSLFLWFIHSLAGASYVPGSEVGIGDIYPQSKT